MGVFDSVTVENDKIILSTWIEWVHRGIPDDDGITRELVRKSIEERHCLVCTSMDACFYPRNNMPVLPQHEGCDCYVKTINYAKVKNLAQVNFPIGKLTNYIFNETNLNNKGKAKLFKLWGFSIEDSNYIQDSLSTQALKSYLRGDFVIKGNNGYGTLIKITVNLNGRTWGTGWIVQPQGKIKNVTPYADDI